MKWIHSISQVYKRCTFYFRHSGMFLAGVVVQGGTVYGPKGWNPRFNEVGFFQHSDTLKQSPVRSKWIPACAGMTVWWELALSHYSRHSSVFMVGIVVQGGTVYGAKGRNPYTPPTVIAAWFWPQSMCLTNKDWQHSNNLEQHSVR